MICSSILIHRPEGDLDRGSSQRESFHIDTDERFFELAVSVHSSLLVGKIINYTVKIFLLLKTSSLSSARSKRIDFSLCCARDKSTDSFLQTRAERNKEALMEQGTERKSPDGERWSKSGMLVSITQSFKNRRFDRRSSCCIGSHHNETPRSEQRSINVFTWHKYLSFRAFNQVLKDRETSSQPENESKNE